MTAATSLRIDRLRIAELLFIFMDAVLKQNEHERKCVLQKAERGVTLAPLRVLHYFEHLSV
jgi:hypothetical protein